jgi:NAD(P)-dependent dehydrogenase (short-subunit alcohol dehydrogenase family)
MKNILVIGGSSGIGLATAQLLSQNNNVYATYNKNVQSNANQLQYFPVNVLDENMDLSFLPEQLHGVVYCPGSINLRPFARIAPADFIIDYQLQVVGAIKIIQTVLPKLKASGNASIVLFSTVAVQGGFTFHSQVSASKGALEGLTKALAAELAPTIRVNCIAPSITNTPLASALLSTPEKIEASAQRHPLKKVGEANDLAEAVQFLLNSHWTTGQVLHIDGGMSTIKM